jgi:hypothetical protein
MQAGNLKRFNADLAPMALELPSQDDSIASPVSVLDQESGRTLSDTLSVHTLELGKFNLTEQALAEASQLDRWLYCLLHAEDYEAQRLMELSPEEEIRRASQTLITISEITEDKTMYDAREKAIRDQQWAINVARDDPKS